jgi:2-oxoglutarate ferredoxin oxidoreductase subunit alpha
MSEAAVEKGLRPDAGPRIVNDFSMVVATANGSGSQTSNLALIRALFRMGLPVGGKNLFPSNIQGLPTWFTIRVSGEGFTARRETVEILVAMNIATFADDLKNLSPGGVCFYDERLALPEKRSDVVYYSMPVKDLVQAAAPPKQFRDYIGNMAYVGVVAQMLGIDIRAIREALMTHFQGREKPVEMNMGMVESAAEWARQNLEKMDPYQVEADNQTKGKILIDGNTAGAMGAVYGGVSFISWYPITPASSLADAIKVYLPQLRKDQDSGKNTYAIIQSEDELSAIGMAIGAGWAGARAMTSTSGPGISLMAEFAGLAFFAEIPLVIWDVQRMGPSTGLPTRTSQGDLLFVRFLGHGDTRQVVLLPGTVDECFEFGWRAFDAAEKLQTPVFILSDLDLGMNLWMSDPFAYPEQPMDRGKVLSAADLDRLGEFARYRDVDGDFIPYRTLPGNKHPLSAWFARGTGHNEHAIYSEDPDDWERNITRLMNKHESAWKYLPEPLLTSNGNSNTGIIAYGSTDSVVKEALSRMKEDGLDIDYLRVRSLPFGERVHQFVREHNQVFVVEMNTDGQLRMLLQWDLPDQAMKLHSLTHNNGIPLTARWIHEQMKENGVE